MKLRLILLAFFSLSLIGAKGADLATITLINKSGMSVNVSLLADDLSRNYFLNLPKGDRQAPYITKLTIVNDLYRMRVYWLDDTDPATGTICRPSRSAQLVAGRNMRVVITECDRRRIPPGEPTMYKFVTESCMY